jgi:integrase/recombinase XerC
MNALAPVAPQPDVLPSALFLAGDRQRTARDILEAWRAGKSPATMKSYAADLVALSRFLSAGLGITPQLTVEAALDRLFAQDSASAHGIVLSWRNSMLEANLSAATINRALATLRSVSKLARMLGIMTWYCEVPGVKAEPRRDTRGPAVGDVRKMPEATSGDSETEARDAAIITTLFCCGLRVSELVGLNREDVDVPRGTAWIKGKGRREKERVPLPTVVVEALRRYLAHFGATGQGPLFVSRSHRVGLEGSRRLHPGSVLRIVQDVGQRVGVRVWPHALRHCAITTAVARGHQAGLRLDQLRAYSRHKSIATLLVYVDETDRAAVQSQATDLVAASLVA